MDWHIILAAVATSTSLHAVMEPGNILLKLWRLEKTLDTGKVMELPMKGIDTRAKAYGVGLVAIAAMSALAYVVVNLIDPSPIGAMQYSVVVIVLAEIALMMRIDRYHVDIEKITQKQAKPQKKK